MILNLKLLLYFSAYFNTVVQACYNLQLVQVFLKLSYLLSPNQRRQLQASVFSGRPSVAQNVKDIIDCLDKTGLYVEVKLITIYSYVLASDPNTCRSFRCNDF